VEEKTEAVQRMQNYIETHLYDQITPADLSGASRYSPWYAARIFKELTGAFPADYIRRLRLSKSALRLRDEKCRIADVAFDMGFNSVDGYQRAFLREFSCNPREYAKRPVPLPLYTPFGVKFKDFWKETKMENVKNVFIQVIEKPARKVLIKRGEKAPDYFAYCQEVGCDIWGVLISMKSLGEPVSMWLPDKLRAGKSEYVQGVDVPQDYDGAVPEGFDTIELPKAKYLMFQGEPFDEVFFCEAIRQVQDAMDKYDPSFIGYAWDDQNPRIQLEPVGARGYIEMRAVN